jgi:tetratricopeptide (TPR) repeat protein
MVTNSGRILRDLVKSARSASPRLRGACGALVLLALCFVLYAPSWRYDPARHEGYVWDDDDHFLNDPLVRAPDGWWRVFADPQPGVVGEAGGAVVWNYWPVTRLSFWVDRHLWGVDARGMPDLVAARLTNVALHALNALLLVALLRRLRVPGAWLAGLLLALHPMAVESVAWITERKALLSTALCLATALAWLRSERDGGWRWYLATAALFAVTLLAKTSTVMLPVLFVLLHAYERRRWDARSVLRLAPFFAMSLVAGVTSIVFERFFIGSQGAHFATSLAERVAAAGWIVWFYFAHTLVPLGVSFNYPRFDVEPSAPLAWAPSAALLVAAALLFRHRAGPARPAAFALAAFVASLFPVMGFFGVYGMRYAHVADHWLYLAAMPLLALAAALGTTAVERIARARPSLARPARALGLACVAAVAAAFGVASARHAAAFVDRETLWRHTLERSPDSFLASNNLGVMRLEAGRWDEAIALFRRATESEPGFAEGFVNLGNALDASGRTAEAVPQWERAVALDPEQAIALYNLAVARIKEGRLDEAEALARRASDADPRDVRPLQALHYVFEQQGRPAALEPFVLRARQAPAVDRAARGRRVAAGIGIAYGWIALVCVALAFTTDAKKRRS